MTSDDLDLAKLKALCEAARREPAPPVCTCTDDYGPVPPYCEPHRTHFSALTELNRILWLVLPQLIERLERAEQERASWIATHYPGSDVNLLIAQRDAALARAEKAEQERDEALGDGVLSQRVCDILNERDAALARAEKAEQERGELRRVVAGYQVAYERVTDERDVALARAEKWTHSRGRGGTTMNDVTPKSTRAVVAFCPKCGGWTMFHGDADSDTAKQWVKQCYVQGELILTFGSPVRWIDKPCTQSDVLLDERTCCDPDDRGCDS